MNIRIEARQPTSQIPHTLFAIAQFKDGAKVKNIPIGTVSSDSVKEHDIKPGMTIRQGKVEFHFGISDGMIDALKQQTREYVESVREATPLEDKPQLAAAIHDVSHTGERTNFSGLKRAGVAFAIFPEEAIAQLQNLQFTEMRVIGTQFNECAGRSFAGEKVAITFMDDINPREPSKIARWVTVEGKKLGIIDARSPHLLAGYEAVASIISPSSTNLIVTSLKNPINQIQIDRVNQYVFSDRNWQGEQASITLDVQQANPRKTPVVVEIQAESENGFEERMFLYNLRIFDKFAKPPISVAILCDSSTDWRPHQYSYNYPDTRLNFEFGTVKLLDYQNRWQELEASDNPFATVVMAHLKTQETRKKLGERKTWKFSLIRRLYEQGCQERDIRNLYRFIDWIMMLPRTLETEFWQEFKEYEQERRMSYITTGERIGYERGQQEQAQNLVLRQLQKRFGELPQSAREQIQSLSTNQLETLSEALLDFTGLNDLVTWLAENPANSN